MKNFAIIEIINSKPPHVNRHGYLPKEMFKMFHLKNKLTADRTSEIIENRIAVLDAAEKLALSDNNPANMDENLNMILRCISGKIELMNVRELLHSAS